ncbi:DUF3180 domain-containing protein [Actinopolyspora saharensis]|uniref:DUF3180 domain-containing protein n=1 Tax=Actinopolyspora saharensis TaxID=995062 RepID=A0A1H1F5M6_9ACTN|nr:DUF3180 domain-containing protein [Actinopolyspora saharensis]SDQ96089.1 Protein of unknown function [Actinopolyspora saharensis]
MSYTRTRDLVAAALIAAVLVYGAVQVGYGALPPLPLAAGATLLVVALVEVVLAFVVRPKVQRKPGIEPLDPMTATRVVALAKASSLAGALMGGAWVALLVFLLPRYGPVEVVKSDTAAAVIGLISAVALIGAGLWLEWCMRNPDEPEEDTDSEDE